MAFVSDAVFNGQRFRTLTLIDVFTRAGLAMDVDIGMRAERVVEGVTAAVKHRARPVRIQVDPGREVVSNALDLWAYEQGVTLECARPGTRGDNAHLESWGGSVRDECLKAHGVLSLEEAAKKIERWSVDDPDFRPHSALGTLAPAAFAGHSDLVHRPSEPSS